MTNANSVENPRPIPSSIVDNYINFLSYNDVDPVDRSVHVNFLQNHPNARHYAEELGLMFNVYGKGSLIGEAQRAVNKMHIMLQEFDMVPNPYSKSPSWFLWHAAKMSYLAHNPSVAAETANANKYNPVDPFLDRNQGVSDDQIINSRRARDEILFTHLGWELYDKSRTNIASITENLHESTPFDVLREIKSLASELPTEGRDTLSSYKLQRLGELAWTCRKGGLLSRFDKSFIVRHKDFLSTLEEIPVMLRFRLACLKDLRQKFSEFGFNEIEKPRYYREQDLESTISFKIDTLTDGELRVLLISSEPSIIIDAEKITSSGFAKELNAIIVQLKESGITVNPTIVWRDGEAYLNGELPEVNESISVPEDPNILPSIGAQVLFNGRRLIHIGNSAFYDPNTQEIVELTSTAITSAQAIGRFNITSLPRSKFSDVIMGQSRKVSGDSGNSGRIQR